ncbi:DUF1697 domain-containing protein [Maribellus sp. YY47]|uniref:DUF1697 domain-containing protein n=1 Tax=Maribellus sp. YY47 TaxID=2929486 RepID=UPI002000AE43|nr:DUF1697 domain-containing protein [Maribellus sp. YY47]MCK3683025.1 DUF1697 domain-containing protein [Maribellus sp. YY47]
MQTCISILRGINVSGRNSIKMADLKTAYEALGFQRVTTYIQSGNVVFESSETDQEKLSKKIHLQIQSTFGYDIPVLVVNVDSWQQIIEQNPFAKDSSKDPAFLHVTFLASAPELSSKDAILTRLSNGEEIQITSGAVYLYCPHGYGRTKLNNNFLEAKLGVQATTRNWKTTLKLLEIAKNVWL